MFIGKWDIATDTENEYVTMYVENMLPARVVILN